MAPREAWPVVRILRSLPVFPRGVRGINTLSFAFFLGPLVVVGLVELAFEAGRVGLAVDAPPVKYRIWPSRADGLPTATCAAALIRP